MQNENASYESYHGMIANVNTALVNMADLCQEIGLDEAKKNLNDAHYNLTHNQFSVGIMGEFRRGKSTVINSLLGNEIMPSDIVPTTATMNRVRYGTYPYATLIMHDGTEQKIEIEQLSSYVTKVNAEAESNAAKIDYSVVYYPCQFCQNGVEIVDTPGLNDDERMDKISEETIPTLDAVVMVLVPGNPLSESEADFVRNKLMSSDVGKLIFVVNKIDTVRREKDRERIVENIRDRIKTTILSKTEDLYGTDSSEYQEAKAKVGCIRIYPVSAIDALEGRLNRDEALVNQSGIKAFEDGLTYMLTVERGALQLIKPIRDLTTSCQRIVQTANAMKESQKLSAGEFAKRQQEAMEKIRQIRKDKKSEALKIDATMKQTVANTLENCLSFYQKLEEALLDEADQVSNSLERRLLKETAYQKESIQKIASAVSTKCNQMSRDFAELEYSKAMKDLEVQNGECGAFLANTELAVSEITISMGSSSKMRTDLDFASGAAGIMAEAATTFMGIAGVGGAVEGFKKGGVLGGVAGAAAGFGTVMLFGALVSAGVLTGGIPLVIISSIASSGAGRIVGSFIGRATDNGNKAYNEMMKSVRTQIESTVANMKTEKIFETQLKENIETAFEQLKTMVNAETDRILLDTQNSLDAMRDNLTKSELERKQVEKKCDDVIFKAERIVEEIKPVIDQVKESRRAN